MKHKHQKSTHHTEEATTLATTRKKIAINVLKVLIIGVLVVSATRLPYTADNYEYVDSVYSDEYVNYKKKYKVITAQRDSLLNVNEQDFKLDAISKEVYFKNRDSIDLIASSEIEVYNVGKKALQEKYKYRGWNAYFLYIMNISPYIMCLVGALLFLFVVHNPTTFLLNKIAFSIFGSLFLFTSTYFILHAHFAYKMGDFPDSWYQNAMRYIPIIVSLTAPILFYHFQTIEQKLRTALILTIKFIVESKKYISPDQKREYKKHYTNTLKKTNDTL